MLVNEVQIGAGVGLEGVTILAVALAVAAFAVRYAGGDEPGVGAAATVIAGSKSAGIWIAPNLGSAAAAGPAGQDNPNDKRDGAIPCSRR